jgi:hypothetical protein
MNQTTQHQQRISTPWLDSMNLYWAGLEAAGGMATTLLC